jgi:hypothetical protein
MLTGVDILDCLDSFRVLKIHDVKFRVWDPVARWKEIVELTSIYAKFNKLRIYYLVVNHEHAVVRACNCQGRLEAALVPVH